jgi:hypothetical protein
VGPSRRLFARAFEQHAAPGLAASHGAEAPDPFGALPRPSSAGEAQALQIAGQNRASSVTHRSQVDGVGTTA